MIDLLANISHDHVLSLGNIHHKSLFLPAAFLSGGILVGTFGRLYYLELLDFA